MRLIRFYHPEEWKSKLKPAKNNRNGLFIYQNKAVLSSFLHHEKETKLIIKKDDNYAVECQVKMAPDCLQAGEFMESEEDAVDWVEEECWINSGEGWICTQCNEQILRNIANLGKPKGM